MKMNMIVRREHSSFAGEVRTKTEYKRGVLDMRVRNSELWVESKVGGQSFL